MSEFFSEPRAVELTGEFVMAAEIEQPLVLLAPVVDHAQRALCKTRARLVVDIADTCVLDPKRCSAAAALREEAIVQAILDLGVG
jgi:hypothetical protein